MISETEQIKVEQYLQKVKQRELLAKETKKEYERNCYLKRKQNGRNNRESEESKAKKKEIIECECGAKIARGYFSEHEKTIKHQNFERSPEDKPVIDNLISFREYLDQNKIIMTNNRDELYDKYWNIEKKKKITCECGEIICRAYLPQHKRTIKHQTYLVSVDNLRND
jgi:hypothetical protein